MATLPKNYEHSDIEQSTYELWLEANAFDADPDSRGHDARYVIMMPLPNVTGALHMGHAMDNVMQDLLIRWHRMMGHNTLWQPGTDHAGIATQAVIEKRLKELEGKTRHDVGRDGLVERIWRWKDQYERRIIEQQQRMGCSCDWRRHRFTMDEVCARAVRHAFFHMFGDGLIFRGKRLVNWDVFLQTSVSDDEVYHQTVAGHFWHLRYPVIDAKPGEPAHVVVATTRPETMLGDTAVAVHPDPAAALAAEVQKAEAALERASDKERAGAEEALEALRARQRDMLPRLVQLAEMARDGRKVRLPLMEREIPLICDEWAKPALGSGCVKITPAHDPNDYDVWQRHKDHIDIINILLADGTLAETAGSYAGLDRFAARDKVVADLDGLGLLERVEERETDIGHSDRSKTPIEPFLSDQWYVRMGDVEGGVVMGRGTQKEHRAAGLVQAAMDAVTSGRVSIHPERYTKTYLDWLGEKRDWPISRQLWWGHRIPVWSKEGSGRDLPSALPSEGALARVFVRDRDATFAVAGGALAGDAAPLGDDETWVLDVCLLDDDEAAIAALEGQGFARDPDVLDTWFSSALWPFSTLGWPDPASAPVNDGQISLAERAGIEDALSYYYPGGCLVTGRDIITLWVARMVLAGLYCLGDIPFSDVFIHANIQDGKGERMSKSKGNGIDPVDIIDRYGADAMRYVLCDMQTGSQDIRLPVTAVCPSCGHPNKLAETHHGRTASGQENLFTYVCGTNPAEKKKGCGKEFDVLGTLETLPKATPFSERFDSGRSFCTKLWNSVRFALMNLEGGVAARERSYDELHIEDRWILDRLDCAKRAVQAGLDDYNPSAAINAARDFFWSELCDWYLELIKPRLAEGADAESGALARQVLAYCLDQVLRLLHPFVPFISEYLWQRLGEVVPERGLGKLAAAPAAPQLINADWPRPDDRHQAEPLRPVFADLQAVTRGVREARASAGISPRQPLTVTIKPPADRAAALEAQAHIVAHLAGVESLSVDPAATRPAGAAAKLIASVQLYVHDIIDDDSERKRLQEELGRVGKEITICEKKLSNTKFVERAPADVVEEQRQRLAGYQSQKQTIEAELAELG
ncbi:MAG: valine--tRNA ligase [Myxococcales bacterium]|nr:valine--tRNA ligase [Myxococcales bacterium]